jgi:hypothetical protein
MGNKMNGIDFSAASDPEKFRTGATIEPEPETEPDPFLWAHTKCPGCGGIMHRETGCCYCRTGKYSEPEEEGESANPVPLLLNPSHDATAGTPAPIPIPADRTGETGLLFEI